MCSCYVACLGPAFDIILPDYHMAIFDALRALSLLPERRLDFPFIVVTGSMGDEAAVRCIKWGTANDLQRPSGALGLGSDGRLPGRSSNATRIALWSAAKVCRARAPRPRYSGPLTFLLSEVSEGT